MIPVDFPFRGDPEFMIIAMLHSENIGCGPNSYQHNTGRTEAGIRTPKPNEREMSYLLQSTWCAVASVGASLKVVCMP